MGVSFSQTQKPLVHAAFRERHIYRLKPLNFFSGLCVCFAPFAVKLMRHPHDNRSTPGHPLKNLTLFLRHAEINTH